MSRAPPDIPLYITVYKSSPRKDGEHGHAARVMTEAAREFEDLGEAEDWSVAQQKLARS
jgi:hypothetical protein